MAVFRIDGDELRPQQLAGQAELIPGYVKGVRGWSPPARADGCAQGRGAAPRPRPRSVAVHGIEQHAVAVGSKRVRSSRGGAASHARRSRPGVLHWHQRPRPGWSETPAGEAGPV